MTKSKNANEHRHAEDQVKKWLKEQNAVYAPDLKSELSPVIVDFVVLKPIPFAIEIMSVEPQTMRMKSERLLARRIGLANRFGPKLPLIAIIPKASDLEMIRSIPFVDAVFSADALPNLAEIHNMIRLDGKTQRILQQGAPKDVILRDTDEITVDWSDTLTLEDIVDGYKVVPGTIAEQLHERAKETLVTPNLNDNRRNINRIGSREVISDPIRQVLMSTTFNDSFEDVINSEILRNFKGVLSQHMLKLPIGTTRVQFWQSPTGSNIVWRRLILSPEFAIHKNLELLADAWLLRASKEISPDGLVLLLGSAYSEKIHSIAGIRRISKSFEGYTINQFEEAGWKVFPWDFSRPIPAFIQYMAKWSERNNG